MAKKFYLKERHNPQFNKPYYVAEGQLTKADAQRTEDAVIDTATLLTSSHNCSNTLVAGSWR